VRSPRAARGILFEARRLIAGQVVSDCCIEDKLDVLCIECTKCARKGRYSVRRLIEKFGRKGNLMKWKEQLNGDCPKRDAHSMLERCDLVCPDLPKVLCPR
jgi:hypothetical protein